MGTIGTFTLNPAVDKHCAVGRVVHDRKLRTHDVRYDPGGGGVERCPRVRRDRSDGPRALHGRRTNG